jgi:hypothetical protein
MSFVDDVRRSSADVIENYERQVKDGIAQSEELVKDVPVVRVLAGMQADAARAVVDAQTWAARQLIGA